MAELSSRTVEIWARILHAVPNSQMLLLDHNFRAEENTQRLLGLFGNFGLAHRVDVVNEKVMVNFFRGVDIALVPVHSARPDVVVNAMWASAPMVCLDGAGRYGREPGAALSALGLAEDTLAGNEDDYVAKAVQWAGDEAARQAFGRDIRSRLRTSPFFDGATRVADLERAYEDLWRNA